MMWRFADLLNRLDPDERDLLLGTGAGSAQHRQRYIEWLEERGDPRAEVLRLSQALADDPRGAAADRDRARLRALADQVDPVWWAVVARGTEIRHCGAAAGEPPLARFTFLCSRTWESLDPTDLPTARHCDHCEQTVYLCNSRDDVARRAQRGQCVAVERSTASDIRDRLTRYMTGRPDATRTWGQSIFPDADE